MEKDTMKKVIIILTLLLFAVSSQAQLVSDVKINSIAMGNGLGVTPANTPFSLLDMSRIKWSHSYSISFFSGGNYSGSAGLLNSTMLYDITSNLTVALNLGVAHDPGAVWGNGNNSATFLPGFIIDYRPSNNFNIRIDYQQLDGRTFLSNKYDRRYWLTEP